MLSKILRVLLLSTLCLPLPTIAAEREDIGLSNYQHPQENIYHEIFDGLLQYFVQIPENTVTAKTYEEERKIRARFNKEVLPAFIEAFRIGYEEALKTLPSETITTLHQYAQIPDLRAFLAKLKTSRETFPIFLRQSLQQPNHLEAIPETATFSYLTDKIGQFKKIYSYHEQAILANAHKTVCQSPGIQKLISFIKDNPSSNLEADVRTLLPHLSSQDQESIITTLTEISTSPSQNWEHVPVYLAIKFGHLLWDGTFTDEDWQNVLTDQAIHYQDMFEIFLIDVLKLPLAPYIPSIHNFSQAQQKNILLNALIFYHNDLKSVHSEGFAKYELLPINTMSIIYNLAWGVMNSPHMNPQMAEIFPLMDAIKKDFQSPPTTDEDITVNDLDEEPSDGSSSAEEATSSMSPISDILSNTYQGIYNTLTSFWQNRPWP